MQVGNAPLLSGPVMRVDGTLRVANAGSQASENASANPRAAVAQAPADDSRVAREERDRQSELNELERRERAVKAEQFAKAALAGQYAAVPVYSFTRGPDGQTYAVSGDVSIDVSPVPNDPQATLRKMQVVLQAALAGGDARVVAQARAVAAQAQTELAEAKRLEEQKADDERQDERQKTDSEDKQQEPRQMPLMASSLELYRVLDAIQANRSEFSARA